MKTSLFLSVICSGLFYSGIVFSQGNYQEIPKTISPELQLNDEPQKFLVVTTHLNSDKFGNFLNRMQVKGIYSRGLPDDSVKWNDVTVSMSMKPAGEFPEGEKLQYMEDFTYVPSAGMMDESTFTTFAEYSAFAKNLIWDMMGIEGLAWANLKQLEMNKPFSASDFNSKIELAGQGFFENKNMMLTWTGISERNNEACAVVEYRTLNNPMEYAGEGMSMKGISHYWGNICVSMEDMQVEHATLFEVVTAEMKFSGQQNEETMSILRDIEFIKLP